MLDFYVTDVHQRQGLGLQLFSAMLEVNRRLLVSNLGQHGLTRVGLYAGSANEFPHRSWHTTDLRQSSPDFCGNISLLTTGSCSPTDIWCSIRSSDELRNKDVVVPKNVIYSNNRLLLLASHTSI